jgi:hypothetical protein
VPPAPSAAFWQGLGIWAWLEMSYLMGFITGPAQHALPATTPRLAAFLARPADQPLP